MKLTDSHAIILTSDRQFLRVPSQKGMQVGQEIECPKRSAKPFFSWRKIGLLVASLVLALGIWQSVSWFRPVQVLAYVTIDINPSFELAVDQAKEVVRATPLNADAEKLITHLQLKGKPIESAVHELAMEAVNQGFVKPDGEILVTTSNANNASFDIKGLEQAVIASVQEILRQKGIQAHVGGVLVSESVREQAKELGLSPGKYALYLQAQANGLEISLNDLKQESVSAVVKKHGPDIEQLVRSMKGDKKLEDLLKEQKQSEKAAAPASGDVAGQNVPVQGNDSPVDGLLNQLKLPSLIKPETNNENDRPRDGDKKDGDKKDGGKKDDGKKEDDKKDDYKKEDDKKDDRNKPDSNQQEQKQQHDPKRDD